MGKKKDKELKEPKTYKTLKAVLKAFDNEELTKKNGFIVDTSNSIATVEVYPKKMRGDTLAPDPIEVFQMPLRDFIKELAKVSRVYISKEERF